MFIGKLVKSNAHTDYICQVYDYTEVKAPPAPIDYAFGTFVQIPLEGSADCLVGLIYDTQLLNPDFGNLGPRLSPASDLAVFSPDYLAEKVTLVGITAIGTLGSDGRAVHGVPSLAAQTDALVEQMEDDAVLRFHQPSQANIGLRICYAPLLLTQGGALTRYLLLNVIDRLAALLPEQAAPISVLRGQLAWEAFVAPLGGAP